MDPQRIQHVPSTHMEVELSGASLLNIAPSNTEETLQTNTGALYLGKRIRFAPSLQKVIRCLNCQRFGHVEAQCRGGDKARSCHNCASNDHLSKECNSNSIACINCIRRINQPENWFSINPSYNDDLPTLLDFAPWLKDFDPNLGKEHNQSPTKDIPESYSSVISRKNTLKKQTSNRRALTARRRKRYVFIICTLWILTVLCIF
ncbi:uncharacterized protein LOC105184214 isoform X2 [Harpegnathos saltator]|uniref:uncharacterized protein LOC105184214 isoform X2 n=1 Tax=Harpegnathos saltator TaxID=610380 RepID=UPI000DBEDC63|nr:uncharacterized protein LOC105184214 isoform X2 [Harpegnathos saltator]